MRGQKPFEVLIVEDNAPDTELLKVLLANCKMPLKLSFVSNGIEGGDYLWKRGQYQNAATPDLILVDLNLPVKSGKELLQEIKADSTLCKIPVIVISTSTTEKEIADVYCNGATAFISKPMNLDVYQET